MRDLTRPHGLLTLAALPCETGREGEEAWRAVWARKGRGFSLVREEGYIVRRNGEISHGRTLCVARANLTRRETQERLDKIEADIYRKLETCRLNGLGSVEVGFGDSRRAGNCMEGTRAFRDREFPGRSTATVRELCAVAQHTNERRFVYGACLQAIRRNSRAALAT